MASQLKVARKKSPGLSIPMDTRTAYAVAREENSRNCVSAVRTDLAYCENVRVFLFGPQEQIEPHRVAQLILNIRWWKICSLYRATGPRSIATTSRPRLRHLVSENGAGPAEANDDNVFGRKFARP